jgi:hypothetical protein
MRRSNPTTVLIKVEVVNSYELFDEVTVIREEWVPAPPADEESPEYEAWEYQWIFDLLTGTGRSEGESWYDVTVLESSRPDLIAVGAEFVFGY